MRSLTPGSRVTPQGRYHEMDGLRGSMMSLGVALHAAVAYMRTHLPARMPPSD